MEPFSEVGEGMKRGEIGRCGSGVCVGGVGIFFFQGVEKVYIPLKAKSN